MEHAGKPYEWVGAWSEKRAELSPNRIALKDLTSGNEYSYSDLDQRANRAARLLQEYDIEKGDRVAVISRNRPEFVDLFFATAKLGTILAPLSFRLASRELTELLNDVEPSILIVEEVFESLLEDILENEKRDFDCPILIIKTDNDSDRESYEEALPSDPSPVESADVSMDDPHLFLHTGGSTGLPKETVVTHRAILWNSFNTIVSWGLKPDDTTAMVYPMFHTGGWNVLTVPIFHLGGKVIITREFDPNEILHTIEEEKVTVFSGVPAMLRMICQDEDWEKTDISSLRLVKSGGGPCRKGIIQKWWDRGIDLSQGYGLTECGPNNFTMPDDWPHEKVDSVGKPTMHVEVRIVDEDGNPTEDIGELELSSPVAAEKYWRNEEETEETFGGGWVSTGDLASVDEDGYYYIEGRKKNMFVSGGENVYPVEIENVITEHEKVDDVIVIGVPDDRWGEVGKAVIQGDESLTLEELTEFLEDKIAKFKIPKHLDFVEEMPMSGPSKIDRQTIKEKFGGRTENT